MKLEFKKYQRAAIVISWDPKVGPLLEEKDIVLTGSQRMGDAGSSSTSIYAWEDDAKAAEGNNDPFKPGAGSGSDTKTGLFSDKGKRPSTGATGGSGGGKSGDEGDKGDQIKGVKGVKGKKKKGGKGH
jgi:hypothetical protein